MKGQGYLTVRRFIRAEKEFVNEGQRQESGREREH